MRVEEILFGEAARVGRDERQIARIGEIEQMRLGTPLHLVEPANDLDIEAIGEQGLQAIGIGLRARRLILGIEPGEPALPARGQRDQPVGVLRQRREIDMRHLLDRAIEVRHADQSAEIVVAGRVLRIERKPVEHRRDTLGQIGPRDAEHDPDHRLHPGIAGRVGIGHRRIKAVAIGQRRRRKAERRGALGDRLGLDRPVEHRVG